MPIFKYTQICQTKMFRCPWNWTIVKRIQRAFSFKARHVFVIKQEYISRQGGKSLSGILCSIFMGYNVAWMEFLESKVWLFYDILITCYFYIKKLLRYIAVTKKLLNWSYRIFDQMLCLIKCNIYLDNFFFISIH